MPTTVAHRTGDAIGEARRTSGRAPARLVILDRCAPAVCPYEQRWLVRGQVLWKRRHVDLRGPCPTSRLWTTSQEECGGPCYGPAALGCDHLDQAQSLPVPQVARL